MYSINMSLRDKKRKSDTIKYWVAISGLLLLFAVMIFSVIVMTVDNHEMAQDLEQIRTTIKDWEINYNYDIDIE